MGGGAILRIDGDGSQGPCLTGTVLSPCFHCHPARIAQASARNFLRAAVHVKKNDDLHRKPCATFAVGPSRRTSHGANNRKRGPEGSLLPKSQQLLRGRFDCKSSFFLTRGF